MVMGFFANTKKTAPSLSTPSSYVAPDAATDVEGRVQSFYPGTATEADDYTKIEDKTIKTEGTDSTLTITRDGQYLTLNGFVNGHLMRWKFAAEEGPTIIRVPALLLAIGCMVTTIYPLVTDIAYWTIPTLICAFHTCVLCILILFLEGRVICSYRNPLGTRARVRGITTRYLNFARFLWGRGLLYIYAGSMNLTIDWTYEVYTGVPLICLGIAAIYSGANASNNLEKMKASLTDVSYLWARFESHDVDNDALIDLSGFAELLWDLGFEFDDVYTYKAFQQIDRDGDGKVSFEDFKNWWVVIQDNGN